MGGNKKCRTSLASAPVRNVDYPSMNDNADLDALIANARRGDWASLARCRPVRDQTAPSIARSIERASELARFNLAASRAVRRWTRGTASITPAGHRLDHLASLAVARVRALVDGRAREARNLLAQELDAQPRGTHGQLADQPAREVVELLARGVRSGAVVRVRGVGRFLPDAAYGLGDPGSDLALGLLGFPAQGFERGRPLDLLGVWNSRDATFEVQRSICLGLWPGRRVILDALNADRDPDERVDPAELQQVSPQEDPKPRAYASETLALRDALDALEQAAVTSGITLRTLGTVHRLLAPNAKQAGEIRSNQVTVRLGNVPFYHPPAPAVARAHVRDLLRWLSRAARTVHPLPRAAEAWARLTEAHPFTDGNGRVARAFADWILRGAGYRSVDAGELRDFTQGNVVEYYHRLESWRGETLLWYQFCADAIVATYELPAHPWLLDEPQNPDEGQVAREDGLRDRVIAQE